MCSTMTSKWKDVMDNPIIDEKVTNRLVELAKTGLTHAKIRNTIYEELDVLMCAQSIRKKLAAEGIKKNDCRNLPRIKPHYNTPLDQEWRKIRHKEQKRQYDQRVRKEVFEKLSGGDALKCGHCGCPHPLALTLGHINGSRIYKRRNKALYKWIIRTPIEEVREHIRIECIYCNFFEGLHGRYPKGNEIPIWSEGK